MANDPRNKYATTYLSRVLLPVLRVAVRFHGNCRKAVIMELANVVMSDAGTVSISISAKM